MAYLFLALGIMLLWIPRGWLRRGRSEAHTKRGSRRGRRRSPKRERMPGDHSLWASEEFLKRRNWIDFGRGLAGGYAVIVALAPRVLTEWRPPFGQPLIWVAAPVLVVGVLMQTLRWEGRITLFPPIFYVLGLAFPLIGGTAAFLAFVAIWAINLVLPSAGVFLFTYAGIGLILGLLMGAGVAPSALLALVALLPPFVAVMSKRRLVQFSKKTKVIIR